MMICQQKLNENLSEPLNNNEVETTIETTVDDDWLSLKDALLHSAEATLGQKQTNARNEWFDQNYMQAVEKQNS